MPPANDYRSIRAFLRLSSQPPTWVLSLRQPIDETRFMTQRYDLVIAGGGPSGSAAAWQAAQTGAKVVVLDKAEFPRDKPCGDGLTARAVSYLQKMGLAGEAAQFHRVNRVTVFSPSQWELSFPKRPGMPDHGHTVSRTELDTQLIKHAESHGAEDIKSAKMTCLLLDTD